MEPISLGFIARSTNGILNHSVDMLITGVSTDTRTLKTGDLYVPLVGERFDGHDFINKAIEKGAGAILTSRDPVSEKVPSIRVNDTLEGLQNLAGAYRKQFDIPVIAVTGSHGKTTTKDLLTHVLSMRFNVHATYRNLNGLIGVPLTILSLNHHHDMLVIETGISKPGEMDILGKIVRPTIAIFTCAAMAHTEFLKDLSMIVSEKSRLFKYLKTDGVRVINIDDGSIASLADSKNSITYGFSHANYQGKILKISPDQSTFEVSSPNAESHRFNIPLPGEFNVLNALAAVSIGLYFELTADEIQSGLNKVRLSPHRCALETINEVTLIDDSYNAAPTSMVRSLEMLARLKNSSRVIAVLGDMLELGDHAVAAHRRVGHACVSLGIDSVFTFGEYARYITDKADAGGISATHYASRDELASALILYAHPGDIILFKASRSMAAEKIIEIFRNQ